jgi:hypothetical protein
MAFLSFMNSPVGRVLRVVLGVVLMVVAVMSGGALGIALGLFALLPMATGAFGVCPVNPLVGQPMRACAVPPRARADR